MGARVRGRRVRQGRIFVVSLAFAALLAACGSSEDASTLPTDSSGGGPSVEGQVVTEPPPSAMCPEGSTPQVVAYEYDGDGVRWSSCSDDTAYRSLLPVSDGVVYVAGATMKTVALDAATGEPVEDAPPPPPQRGVVEGQPYTGQPARVEVGDIVIIAGQDDPVRAVSTDGTELWSQPGVWTYDNVWAIDDGAVFAIERIASSSASRLVAYEVETGDVRWAHEGDPYRDGLWPQYAVDGRLYTSWSNLQVWSTADGALLWRTDYPVEEMETAGLRMTGVDTDGTSVFVSFATEGSGGD